MGDNGPGIPAGFIALFVIMVLIGIGLTVWRVTVVRQMARDSGLDPNKATAVSLLSNDGVGATYLASTLAPRRFPPTPTPPPPPAPATVEERLRHLDDLKRGGLVSDLEYDEQRRKILGDI